MKYGILGGDLRLLYLANIIAENSYNVKVYSDKLAHSNSVLNENVEIVSNIYDFLKSVDVIYAGIPLTRDGITFLAPYSEKTIMIDEVLENTFGKVVFAGVISNEIREKLESNDNKVFDLMKYDEFAIYNAIATAEGTIDVAIVNSVGNLSGSSVLVLGFGRCAKILADKLKGIGAKVTVAARKNTDMSYIESYGYDFVRFNEFAKDINKYDYVINTVPQMVVPKEVLLDVKRDILFIDIASSPGGIDFEAAKDLNITAVQSLGIPGKVAPKASGEIIYKVTNTILGDVLSQNQ